MIYLDSSVILAYLLTEDRAPSESLWRQSLIASRLVAYEVWTRLHARGLGASHATQVASVMARISLVDLSPAVLVRALEPFPVPLRTLDALHLATVEFLRLRGRDVELASFDERLLAAARAIGVRTVNA